MKIGLEIKNGTKALRPKKGSVVIHDGKEWYITTKEDLFREYDERFSAKIAECEAALAEMRELQVRVAKQILAMQEIVSRLIEKESM